MGLRLLLDTHTLYWALADPEQLSEDASAAIPNPENEAFISAASVYELTFKVAIGKLELAADVAAEASKIGLTHLSLTSQHARAAGALPLHHRDPFDRMLVAQAQLEGLTIVTRDRVFEDYGVPLLAA